MALIALYWVSSHAGPGISLLKLDQTINAKNTVKSIRANKVRAAHSFAPVAMAA